MGKIIITITDGKLDTKIEGLKGKGCLNKDKFLYDIGIRQKEYKTIEYYVNNENKGGTHAMVRK